MSGAAVMAATAALRAGSGLVNACVPKEIVGAFQVRPEIMADSDADSDINTLLKKLLRLQLAVEADLISTLRRSSLPLWQAESPALLMRTA